MPERSSTKKARRDSLTSSLGEPESSSLRKENIPSISDREFSEISEKIKKSICRRINDTETGHREIRKMIENLSSKVDSLSGQTSITLDLDTNENCPESLISTSRPIEVNELISREGQHNYIEFDCFTLMHLTALHLFIYFTPLRQFSILRFELCVFRESTRLLLYIIHIIFT